MLLKWGKGNGEWKMGNEMDNEEWGMGQQGNGKLKWEIENWKLIFLH